MIDQRKENNEILKNVIRLICAASIVLLTAISFVIYGAPVRQMVTVLVFFVFYLLLPGMIAAEWTGIECNSHSTYIAISVFSGWAINVLAYFVCEGIDNDIVLLMTGPVLSAAYLLGGFLRKKKKRIHDKTLYIGDIPVPICIFTVLVLAYCLVNTQYRYLAPELCDTVFINPDKAYHMGIINSLSHGYPVHSLWVQGKIMKYHIFTEILFSIPVRLFGLRADVMSMSFAPLFTAFCFVTSFYSFFREMAGKPERAGLYCLLFFPSMMFNIRRWTSSFAFKLILTNDNYAGYGLAAMLTAIVVFSKWYRKHEEKDRSNIKLLILCMMLTMLVTGIKGPIGAVFVCGLWGTMILGIIMRKVNLSTLLPLVMITGSFLYIYATVLGAQGQVNAPGGATIKFGGITNIAFWKDSLIDHFSELGIPHVFTIAAVMLIFAVFFFTIYFIPFCIGYIRELYVVISGRKDFVPAKVQVYAECAVGFIAMMIFSFSGHSQVYFGLVTLILAPIVAYWFIEDMEDAGRTTKAARSVLRATLGIMMITVVFTGALQVSYFERRIKDAVSFSDPSKSTNKYLSISKDEYEAMRWIDNNTEKDSLLASDRYYSVALKKYDYDNRWDNRFFLYEVYSNRPSYISGSGFDLSAKDIPLRVEMIEKNKQLYDSENEERGDLARDLGVDYVVVSKRFTDIADLSNEDYKKCFSNEDIDIYSVKKQ